MFDMLVAPLLLAGPIRTAAAPLDPAQAIARAAAAPRRQPKLDCAFTVVSTQRTAKGVYLHSTDDYRRPDDLTVLVAFPLANRLSKQIGAPIEDALKGKRIVVRGPVQSRTIVNNFSQRAESFNRVQHEMLVSTPEQVLSLG
jgi:hypothetical protein